MAFDGFAVAAVVSELNEKIRGGKIDKIYQGGRDELVLLIRANAADHRLLLTANAANPRAHLIEAERDNPAQAPQFCMLMRKKIGGGRVIAVEQPDFDRVIKFTIDSYEELGDLTRKYLYIEMMGRHSNIILVDDKGFVIDSIHRVPHSISAVRRILPGVAFTPAPNKKQNPLDAADYGFYPFAARFCGVSKQADEYVLDVFQKTGKPVSQVFGGLLDDARNGRLTPNIKFENERPVEFSFYGFCGGEESSPFSSPSAMLEYFYREKDTATRAAQKSADLRRFVANHTERCEKKRVILDNTIAEAQNRETLKLYGELITANAYRINRGDKVITAENYYDATTVDIPLDIRKTPIENAQRYFRLYNKKKRALIAASVQREANDAEAAYLETVLASLQTCETEADVAEIREELINAGYARRRAISGKNGKARKPQKTKPLCFRAEGFEVFVGKNNTQNDELTMKIANPEDIWLHAKDIPGSHVIIRLNETAPRETAILRAAGIAAYFSKARGGSNVPVDYTKRRFVKKPSGAKPGFVIYTNQKTVFVNPIDPYL